MEKVIIYNNKKGIVKITFGESGLGVFKIPNKREHIQGNAIPEDNEESNKDFWEFMEVREA